MEPPEDRETKVSSNDPGHMTKLADMPIYGKNIKISFSPGPKGLETLHAAFGAQVLLSLFK